MITEILNLLCADLNAFLQRREPTQANSVVLSPLIDSTGKVLQEGQGAISCTLLRIEQQTIRGAIKRGSIKQTAPDFVLVLHLQFSPSFAGDNYPEALSRLSDTMVFFQRKALFTPANTPGLPEEVASVSMESLPLDINTLSQVWLAQGVPLQAALHYYCRVRIFSDDQALEVAAISESEDGRPLG